MNIAEMYDSYPYVSGNIQVDNPTSTSTKMKNITGSGASITAISNYQQPNITLDPVDYMFVSSIVSPFLVEVP